MTHLPCAKINLGLNVVNRRADGYHDLETVFYPVPIFDELTVSSSEHNSLTIEGIEIAGQADDNLVMRAYHLLKADYELPPVSIRLQKNIPTEAGLGGGSSDAAFMLRALNELFSLSIGTDRLQQYAARLGADCAFFVKAEPAYATGIGEELQPLPLRLDGYRLAVVKPTVAVSTREAFAGITPRRPKECCRDVVMADMSTWKDRLTNDFEQTIFALHPEIAAIKHRLYAMGATYASMTGSGSAVYGLFGGDREVSLQGVFPDCFTTVLNL